MPPLGPGLHREGDGEVGASHRTDLRAPGPNGSGRENGEGRIEGLMKPKAPENQVEKVTQEEYKYGFTTDIEADSAPPGLNEDIIRFISKKKNEPSFLLEWRLKCYRYWTKMKEPTWASVHYPPINYQDVIYYSAPKKGGPKSLDEVDPEILKMFEKLGVPMQER